MWGELYSVISVVVFFEFLSFLQMPFCFSFSLLFLGFVFVSFTLEGSPEVWSMIYIY